MSRRGSALGRTNLYFVELGTRPIDYKIWAVLQERVYKKRVTNIDELKKRIAEEWDKLDQRIIDNAVKQWRSRLRACVTAGGGHFEYKL